MPMTDTDLATARRFLADTADMPMFTDDELNGNYDFASGSFFMGLYYSVVQLLGDAAKMDDITIGQTSERRSQIVANLEGQADRFFRMAQGTKQLGIVGMQPEPPRERAEPWVTGSVNSVSRGRWSKAWWRGGRGSGWGGW